MENPAFKTALSLLIKSMVQDDASKQHHNHQIILPIGPTPRVLLDLGMPNLQLAILGKVVDKGAYVKRCGLRQAANRSATDPRLFFIRG